MMLIKLDKEGETCIELGTHINIRLQIHINHDQGLIDQGLQIPSLTGTTSTSLSTAEGPTAAAG